MAEKTTVQELIETITKKTKLKREDLAYKLREAGFSCCIATMHKWANGKGPAQNSAGAIAEALRKILKANKTKGGRK